MSELCINMADRYVLHPAFIRSHVDKGSSSVAISTISSSFNSFRSNNAFSQLPIFAINAFSRSPHFHNKRIFMQSSFSHTRIFTNFSLIS